MLFIYEFLQKILFFFIVCLSGVIKNAKFQRFVSIRGSAQFSAAVRLAQKAYTSSHSTHPIFWFHVASAGELEQAIPVAQKLHDKMGAVFFVTYYSPSTEAFLKNFPAIIGVAGLPLDLRCLYQNLFDTLPISKIFFVRYDIWPSLFFTCQKNNVEINLISASVMHAKKSLFPYLQKLWSNYFYKRMNNIFAVSEEDVKYFLKLTNTKTLSSSDLTGGSSGICLAPPVKPGDDSTFPHVYLAGNAKWARAYERAQNKVMDPAIKPRDNNQESSFLATLCTEQKQKTGRKNIVFGSPHTAEHKIALLCSALKDKLFLIYVPHEIDAHHCQKIINDLSVQGVKALLYSTATQTKNADLSAYDAIIVDKIGFLAEIYAFADAAIIGGGFDGKLHNVLEAAAYGVPVLIGNAVLRTYEAKLLVAAKAAISFTTPNEMFQFLSQWVSLDMRNTIDMTHPIRRLELARFEVSEFFHSIPNTSEIILQALLKVKNE